MNNTDEPGPPPPADPRSGQSADSGPAPRPTETAPEPAAAGQASTQGAATPQPAPPPADPYVTAAPPYATASPGGGWAPAPPGGAGYGAPGYSAAGSAYSYPPGYYPPHYSDPGATGSAPALGYTAPTGHPPARRLTRSQDDRVLSGVLGGLARYWNTDPLLLRILTIVLTIATGGALLIGYLIAWIVIPLEAGWPGGPPGAAPGYAAGGTPPYGAGSPGPDSAGFAAAPRPPRSYLGWLVVSIGLILAGVLAIIGTFTNSPVFGAIICSVILIVLGAGLIAGAWFGRARWLTVLAVPMVFVTMAAVAANAWVQSPGADRWFVTDEGGISVGSRAWTVTPEDVANQPLEYRVSAGEAVLDLRQLTALSGSEPGRPAQRVSIEVRVGLGELIVRLPADMRVNLAATVEAGEITLPGRDDLPPAGTDLAIETTIQPLTEGQPAYVVDLDVTMGAGNLEVQRDAA